MENFGQAMPVPAVPLLTALPQRQQVYACFISVWCNGMFHKLSTKINGSFFLIYLIQNIFQRLLYVVKINSHCMKFFICIKRITSRMHVPSSYNLFNLYIFVLST